MAGEWIKIEASTADKPEVLRMARILKIDRDAVFGKLTRLWAWFDTNSVDGVVDGVVDADIDRICYCEGFTAACVSVGWLSYDEQAERVTLPNFDRHNGETAKQRALKNRRQAKWREGVDVNVDAQPSTKASTREEKRREEQKQKQKTAPSGVDFGEVAPEVVVDFTAHRKAQRAPITQTALDAIRREAGKAGLSLEAALVMCCARGWRGFKAEWALGQPATGFQQIGPTHNPGGVSPVLDPATAKVRERDALAAMTRQLREYGNAN